MYRKIALVIIIGILIAIMVAHNSAGLNSGLNLDEEVVLYALNQEQEDWIREKKSIVIGVSDDSAPLITWDTAGNPKGFYKDYLNLIAVGYKLDIHIVPVELNDIESKIRSGEIDAAVRMYDIRLNQTLEFTMPIIKTKGILLVKNRFNFDKNTQGEGLNIVLVKNSPSYGSLHKQLPKAEFRYTDTVMEAVQKFTQGEANALAGSETAIYHFLKDKDTDTEWRRASGYTYEMNDCLAVDANNRMLYDILNNAIYHMENDKIISTLQGKWTGVSYSLKAENKLEGAGIITLIIFAAILSVFSLFYQSNKSLYEELQQRMELLKESQNEMQTTFDGVTYNLAELNRDGHVVSINKAMASYLAIKRHKAMGLPFVSFLKLEEEEKEKLSALISGTFRDESEKYEEIIIGKKLFEIHTFLIKDNKEKVQKILIMMIDITEARSAERQMLQDNKMIAVGQLAAGVAHEIRNPLGLIRNYCYVLKELDYAASKDDAIDVIEKQVNKASRIIENLLNFSRLSTNKKELVDLKLHISAIIDLQKNLLNKNNIEIENEYKGDLFVNINVEAFEIILINLISNSIDAILGNGKITIRCQEQDQNVLLTVSDNGEGIAPEIIDDIYNPFFTTKRRREGSGLGLYIVYNEVQKMGGEIIVESELGAGTTFIIKIPVDREVEPK